MADVFISCSGKSAAADAIADELERAGISYWLAKRHIKGGQTFPEVIPQEIKNCKVFLLALDKNSNQSEHVLSEINLAFSRKNKGETLEFLIFKTDNCAVSDKVHYYINHYQITNGNPPDAQRIRNLISRIAEIVGAKTPVEVTKRTSNLSEKSKLPMICAALALVIAAIISVAIWKSWKRPSISNDTAPTTNNEQGEEQTQEPLASEAEQEEQASQSEQAPEADPTRVKWTLIDGVLTISGKGAMENYEFGRKDGAIDTSIPWWNKKDDIVSIVIKSGVTNIGNHAFRDCRHLTAVTIPSSVTSIGDYAFRRCSRLTAVTIPSSVISIGVSAFAYCGLETVTILNGVTEIGDYAFAYCNSLKTVFIPDSVTSIGAHTFELCANLESVSVPASADIGEWAFFWTNATDFRAGTKVIRRES